MSELVLSNARVLDGRGGFAERATVRVARGRVAEVLPGSEAKAGSSSEEVDLSGQTHRVFELYASWRQADEATPPIRRVNLSPDVALVLEIPKEVVYRLL